MKPMKSRLFSGLLLPLCLAAGCAQREEDRQPTAAEVKEYTARIDRAEADAKAKAIRESRAKEDATDRLARARVPASN